MSLYKVNIIRTLREGGVSHRAEGASEVSQGRVYSGGVPPEGTGRVEFSVSEVR